MADLDKTTALDVGIDPQVLAEAERLYQFKVQNVVTNAKLIKPTPQRPPPKYVSARMRPFRSPQIALPIGHRAPHVALESDKRIPNIGHLTDYMIDKFHAFPAILIPRLALVDYIDGEFKNGVWCPLDENLLSSCEIAQIRAYYNSLPYDEKDPCLTLESYQQNRRFNIVLKQGKTAQFLKFIDRVPQNFRIYLRSIQIEGRSAYTYPQYLSIIQKVYRVDFSSFGSFKIDPANYTAFHRMVTCFSNEMNTAFLLNTLKHITFQGFDFAQYDEEKLFNMIKMFKSLTGISFVCCEKIERLCRRIFDNQTAVEMPDVRKLQIEPKLDPVQHHRLLGLSDNLEIYYA